MVRDASKSWNATLPNKSYETYTLLLQKIGGIALILFYYHDTDSVIPWRRICFQLLLFKNISDSLKKKKRYLKV